MFEYLKMEKEARIFIAGPDGMVSKAIKESLRGNGYLNIVEKNQSELDLLDAAEVKRFFESEKPEYVFLPSYKSGSIKANIDYPAEFIRDNLVVQNNVIHRAYLGGVKKLLFFGASCVYPKKSPQPIKEEYMLSGEVESTSRAYATAKIAGIEMCRAYNKQYGTRFISIIPATLYGPNDRFDLEKSHVLSAMIRKFNEAKIGNQKETEFWGSGRSRREFLFIDDFADACVFIMNAESDFDLFNVGSGTDISIKELAEKIGNTAGFYGEIKWDVSKPDGAERKLLDSSRLNALGWKPRIGLNEGIGKTYDWFVVNRDKIV